MEGNGAPLEICVIDAIRPRRWCRHCIDVGEFRAATMLAGRGWNRANSVETETRHALPECASRETRPFLPIDRLNRRL